ncbi:MAG: Nramp family divalent metal transporter, partial [Planctomycetaceae bacterium]
MSQPNPHDTLPPSQDPRAPEGTAEPPSTFWGILRQVGPGLIIAGSIVGSGELIATTKTGAQAGISLLWLIIIGCLIKVFVQIELGRYTISHGETTLAALDRVPGPRAVVNWIIWFWALTVLVTMGQLGGIVGGVGQALAISFPVKGDYNAAIEMPAEDSIRRYLVWDDALLSEWDLKLHRRWSEAARSEEAEMEDLSAEESAWVRHVVEHTDEFSREVDPGVAEQIAKSVAAESLEDDPRTAERFIELAGGVRHLDDAVALLIKTETNREFWHDNDQDEPAEVPRAE